MKNLIHVAYGKLKSDILNEGLSPEYSIIEDNDNNTFIMKSVSFDEHRFVSLCIYSYNDLLFMDHSSHEVDFWEVHQCTPYEFITFAPELVPYLIDNIEPVTSLQQYL